jgi:hypothetical protein
VGSQHSLGPLGSSASGSSIGSAAGKETGAGEHEGRESTILAYLELPLETEERMYEEWRAGHSHHFNDPLHRATHATRLAAVPGTRMRGYCAAAYHEGLGFVSRGVMLPVSVQARNHDRRALRSDALENRDLSPP